jgi:hypothetical protein
MIGVRDNYQMYFDFLLPSSPWMSRSVEQRNKRSGISKTVTSEPWSSHFIPQQADPVAGLFFPSKEICR